MSGDYDVAVHNARVFADSGQVPDNITTGKAVKYMKERGVWNSLGECWIPSQGVNIDGNNYASKLYGLKAIHDLAQSTQTAQPVYSDGGLVFDGVDDRFVKFLTKAQVLELTSSGSFTMSVNYIIPQLENNITKQFFNLIFDANNSPTPCLSMRTMKFLYAPA